MAENQQMEAQRAWIMAISVVGDLNDGTCRRPKGCAKSACGASYPRRAHAKSSAKPLRLGQPVVHKAGRWFACWLTGMIGHKPSMAPP
jgi:hypothetical protein